MTTSPYTRSARAGNLPPQTRLGEKPRAWTIEDVKRANAAFTANAANAWSRGQASR